MIVRNDLDTSTVQREHKAFATLQAQLAIHGHTLSRIDQEWADGPPSYLGGRGGVAVQLPDLDAVREYLAALQRACVP
jgi:hypothetical protein